MLVKKDKDHHADYFSEGMYSLCGACITLKKHV